MTLEHFLLYNTVRKLVCGAGNEDAEYVYKLVKLFSLAGWRYFDVAAKKDVILAAKKAIQDTGSEGFINVSFGIAGDPHANKATIDQAECAHCMQCIVTCPNNAIGIEADYPIVARERCIGCGRCVARCPTSCISMFSMAKPVSEVLAEILPTGCVDSIEIHAVGDPYSAIAKWREIEKQFDGIMSICVDRSVYSDKALEALFLEILSNRNNRTIIQADGCPMGANDDVSSTLQALAIGQIVDRMGLKAFLMLSGGTNQYTERYADEFDIGYDGVAYGTYARNLVKPYLVGDGCFDNEYVLNLAIKEIQKTLGDNKDAG